MRIDELTTVEEVAESYEVMRELRQNLSLQTYASLVETMRTGGYRLFAGRVDGKIVALAGVGIGTNLYYGRYLWVYELITTETSRSSGYGKALLDYLEALGKDLGCNTIALSSALWRKDAHRFYEEKVDYLRTGYVFQKALLEPAWWETDH